MKKIRLTLVLACFIATAHAQITLTASNINPQPGDIFLQHSISGNAMTFTLGTGANYTWDLSSLSFPVKDTIAFVACSETPACGYFTGANLAQVVNHSAIGGPGTVYNYFNAAPGGLYALGSVEEGSRVDTDVLTGFTMLQYPFTYNDTYSGSFMQNFWMSGDVSHYGGTLTTIADGYGTLITPAGTFSQVLRVHTTREEIDSDMTATDTMVYRHQADEYAWFMNGFHSPLATVQVSRDSAYQNGGINNYFFAAYMEHIPTAVKAVNSAMAAFSCYPNPARGQFSLTFTLQQRQQISITLTDLLGRQVAIITNDTYSVGEHQLNYDTAQLPKGVYLVHVNGDGINATKKIEVQ